MAVAEASWASVGWLGCVAAGWGRARGSAKTVYAHWGLAMVVVVKEKGEGRGF
jgi:hypothetical protein